MKLKTIVSLLAAVTILEFNVSAAEIKTYGKAVGDSSYFPESESKVTLDANGGYLRSGYIGTEKIIELETNKGKIKLPLPYRTTDYDFDGWYTDKGDKVTSDTEYYTDAKLYAKWTVIGEREISFATDGGSFIPPISAKYGESISIENKTPVKEGYKFLGWYLDPRTKEDKVTECKLYENVTVYAKWEQTAKSIEKQPKEQIYMTDRELAIRNKRLQSEIKPIQSEFRMKMLHELIQRLILKLNKA